MTPIYESKEEDPSSHHDADQIDALWATFRLPIPIASKGKYENAGGLVSPQHDAWLLQALDLLRLLHTMESQYVDPNAHKSWVFTDSRERIMESQMMLAYSTLEKLEGMFPSLLHEHGQDSKADSGDVNQVLHQNCHHLLQKLRYDTEQTCAKFQGWFARQSQGRQRIAQERDLIYDIFLAPEEKDSSPINEEDESDFSDEFDDEGEDDEYEDSNVATSNNSNNQSSTPAHSHRPQHQSSTRKREEAGGAVVDPVEFQKQQQDLLEQELAEMAASLKSSTLNMNKTLHTQNKELGAMEELAEKNLDDVSKTAKNVEDRLKKKKGWKKQLATWSLIGTVIGMWVLCFMIMRTVPKRQVGKMPDLFGMAKGGVGTIRKKWGELFAEDENRYDEEEEMWESARQQQEQHRQKQKQARENWKRAEEDRKQQQEDERRRQQQGQQQECEVTSDGTQVCSNSENEADRTAREIAAERRRRRIEENMANAPAVDAIDSVEEKETHHEKPSPVDAEDDPMGCIPPIEEMHVHQSALDSLSKALGGIKDAINRASDGSTQQVQMAMQYEKLQSEVKKHAASLEVGKNKARSKFWVDRENRIKARDWGRALGSIPFCEGGYDTQGPSSNQEEKEILQGGETEAFRKREEQLRLENERHKKFQEEVRLEEEAQKEAEAEMKRVEQERMTAEAAKEAELERIEKERRDGEARRQQEKLAAAAKQAELEKRKQEQIDREKILAEQRRAEASRLAEEREAAAEAEQIEQDRLAAEAKRLEEERLAAEAESEQERLAAEAAKQELFEQERILAEQKREEEEKARRLAAEQEAETARLEQERLVAAAARQAEVDRLEQERLEQERILAEQRRKEEGEARRLAFEQARAEHVEKERLAAEAAEEEEKARQISDAITKAKAGAERAIEQSTQIAADNSEFSPFDVRFAAGRLKNDILAHYISTSPEMVDESDRGGWRPIHEAARAGNLAGVQLLVSAGCDLTSRTGRTGNGGTALWWAVQRFGEDHNVVRLLRSHGALEAGPA